MVPYTSEDETSFGRIEGLNPKKRSKVGSQSRVFKLRRRVLEAFVTSDTCNPSFFPPVSRCVGQ